MLRLRKGKRLQPVDLKKRLVSTMQNERRELPYGDYAPNRYIIFLNPEDSKRWRGLRAKAIGQLKKYLGEQIEKEGYELEGSELVIEIQESDDVNAGYVRVEAALIEVEEDVGEDETMPEDQRVPVEGKEEEPRIPEVEEEVEPSDEESSEPLTETYPDDDGDIGTISLVEFEESLGTVPLLEDEIPPALIKLRVTAGEAEGEEFLVPGKRAVIGRLGGDADISLVDKTRHISRRQFELTVESKDRFMVTDLAKREDVCVYVNGEQVIQGEASPGDTIRIGGTKTVLAEMEIVVV